MKIKLTFLNGSLQGQRFLLTGRVPIGRHPDNALVVGDASVSSRHCEIHFEEGHAFIRDSDSTNGTMVNGTTVDAVMLHDADQVAIGDILCSVETMAEEPSAVQAEPPPPEHLHIQVDQEPPPAGISSADDKITIVPAAPSPETQPHPDHPVKIHPTKVLDRSDVPKRPGRRWLPWANRVAALVLAILVCLAFIRGCIPEKKMLSPKAAKAAYRQMNRQGVELTIVEPAGVDRKADPVTSGVPLPQGSVKDIKDLRFLNQDKQPVPCQFTPLCRWPDGSIKWVLLDFQADVAASNRVSYTLCKGRGTAAPGKPVKLDVSGDSWTIDSGALKVCVVTNMPGLIHSVKIGDREIICATNPVQAVLVNQDGGIYRGSKPTKIVAECVGPMRTTVLVQGQFVDENGSNIFSGKVGYDLRLTAYAGKSEVKFDFTLKNDGWYGYRNEHRPRQWLYVSSLSLRAPLEGLSGQESLQLGATNGVCSSGTEVAQWFKYPGLDVRFHSEEAFPDEETVYRKLWPGPFKDPGRGFYWTVRESTNLTVCAGALPGYFEVGQAGATPIISMAGRRFWENYPVGIKLDASGVTYAFLPRGGFWPRTKTAYEDRTYQVEGGRHKTWELMMGFGVGGEPGEGLLASLNAPLFALAPPEWYRDTGAVLPMGIGKSKSKEAELVEAWDRYNRLQHAKVDIAYGDPAGPFGGSSPGSKPIVQWDKVSIPSLWRHAPEVFMGWMNTGDLVWGFGYCSLHYDWPYAMHENYLRLGNREFFDVGEEMVRHRQDVDQYHVEKDTESYLGGFQRYEKGEHGNLGRQVENYGKKVGSWELNANPSHTWNRGLLLHWALTGDPRSLEAAEQNGRAYERYFRSNRNWAGTNCVEYGEFRVPAWGIENDLALYEYTGGTQWLARAEAIFDKTLLAMEKKNGSQGHILKGGNQSSQFTMYMVEPVCRLHHFTGRKDVLDFLRRTLDWQLKHAAGGGRAEGDRYRVTKWQEDSWAEKPEDFECGAIPAYSIGMLDGYAYLYRTTGKSAYLDLARRLFKESVFYYGCDEVTLRSARTPLGFHYLGTPIALHAEKMQVFLGRYGQLYMQVDADQR